MAEANVPDGDQTEELLAAGRKVLDDARRTLSDRDAALNTAVVPIVGAVPPTAGDDDGGDLSPG